MTHGVPEVVTIHVPKVMTHDIAFIRQEGAFRAVASELAPTYTRRHDRNDLDASRRIDNGQ